MDIDLLSKMVKELILERDRVVLPGLGCFVAEMVPATFSDKGYTINPPYRKLLFRSRPDMGDELIDFYVEANDLDRDVACRILGDFIRELRQIIFTKKVVILPGLGRLRATKENNLFFIPDEDLDIYPAGVGLEPISLKSHVESPQEVASAISGLKSIIDEVAPERVFADTQNDNEGTQNDNEGTQNDEVAEVVADEVAEVEAAAPEAIEPTDVETVETKVTEEEAAQIETFEEEAAQVEADEPETVETVVEEPVEKQGRSAGKRVLVVLGSLVAAAALLLGAYVGLSRINPEIFDSILYSPEELEILYYKK